MIAAAARKESSKRRVGCLSVHQWQKRGLGKTCWRKGWPVSELGLVVYMKPWGRKRKQAFAMSFGPGQPQKWAAAALASRIIGNETMRIGAAAYAQMAATQYFLTDT